MRSLDKFYRYLENREAKQTGDESAVTKAADNSTSTSNGTQTPPTRSESRYVIRNGVTVAVPREADKAPHPDTVPLPVDEIEVVSEPLAAESALDGGVVWRSLPERVQRLALLSVDLLPDAEPQADERRQLIERLLNPLLTLEDTARLLGVCTATVRRYANKGALPHQRTIGQQRRFLLSDVLVLLHSRKPEEGKR